MKLLMICDYPRNPSEITGGVAAAAYNLVQALLEHTDLRITVAGFWKAFRGRTPESWTEGRLRVIRLPSPRPLAHSRNFFAERRLFGRILRDVSPDIVHAQSEGIYASLAVHSGYPNVYTIHGVRLKELRMIRKDIGTVSYLLQSRLIRRHHAKAQHIVAINEYTRNAIAGLHGAKVWVIHNAVDERFFRLKEVANCVPGRLLLVGGVRPRKDIVTCVDAMRILRDRGVVYHLDIVGPNEGVYLEAVRERILAHDLQDAITVHGLVDAAMLDDLYSKADVAMLTSAEESSPICIVEAMAAGKPVVSTDVGGIAEMVEDNGNSFLVPKGDAEVLASKILELIRDREMRDRFATRSHELAQRDWSCRAVALKTREMYQEIIDGHAR